MLFEVLNILLILVEHETVNSLILYYLGFYILNDILGEDPRICSD